MDEGERLLISEAAALLGVHPNTIRHRLRKGHYPYEQVLTPHGPAYTIPRAALQADLAPRLHTPDNAGAGSNGVTPGAQAVSLPVSLPQALEAALQPLVDELARARVDAAAAHEQVGRLQAERDAALIEMRVERQRRYELEQRQRPWWTLWQGRR